MLPCRGTKLLKTASNIAPHDLQHPKRARTPPKPDRTLPTTHEVAAITKIEAHGPAGEIAKLKEPLKDFPVEYWSPGGSWLLELCEH